jgi:hypothetical protein
MGAQQSAKPTTGFVRVVERDERKPPDPDLAALHRLSAVAPLIQPQTLHGLFTRRSDPMLPSLHPRNLNALCREFASFPRHAALPICEEQRSLAKKMSSLEALCARVLYLMALRSAELAANTNTLQELQRVGEQIREARAVLQQCVTRAERCEGMLQQSAAPPGGVLS